MRGIKSNIRREDKMRFLIVGCGSIGERHLRNLKSLGHNVYGFDSDLKKVELVRRRYNIGLMHVIRKSAVLV